MSEIEPQMKADIGPEDFGVPAEFAERARCFHNFMAAEQVRQTVLAERERCARIAEDMVDPMDDGRDECLDRVAAAIRKGAI